MTERVLTLAECADPALAESGICPLPIAGAFLFPLRAITVPGGDVLHMLRASFPLQPGLEAGAAGGMVVSFHLNKEDDKIANNMGIWYFYEGDLKGKVR